MKTTIPQFINNADEAKAFLKALYDNGESYHPEDDAHNVYWDLAEPPTPDECDKLNLIMESIYDQWFFDPCEYLLSLDPEYMAMRDADEKEYEQIRDHEEKLQDRLMNELRQSPIF